MNRRWIFAQHAPISVSIILLVSIAVFLFEYEKAIEAIGATLVAALGFSYFCQQQKLAEIRLFKELFIEFNRRYDQLNGTLSDIRNSHGETRLSPQQIKSLVDYFNLCAEEYLFRQEGYIPDHVWGPWCRGMLLNLGHPAIRPVWDSEIRNNTYYGIDLQEIEAGSKL